MAGIPFTSDNAREMQARSAKKRRENAQTFRDQMQEELLKLKGDVLAKKLLAEDDWRGWVAAVEQAFGKPTEKAEVEHSGSVSINVRSAFDDDRGGRPVPGDDEAEPTVEGVA